MNLALINTNSADALTWRILLETESDGQVKGWISEWPDCQVIADSEEAAIAQLESLLDERLNHVKVVQLPMQSEAGEQAKRILNLPGVDKDDPNFIAIMAEMRAERELDDDNPAYTINW
jgi:hypothetical protein